MTPQTDIIAQTTPTTDDFQYSHSIPIHNALDAVSHITEDMSKTSGILISENEGYMIYKSILDFTMNDYGCIRSAYENPNASLKDLQRMLALDQYIRHSPKWVGSIYRGISVSAAEAENIALSTTIDMKGPSSWSNEMPVAESFAATKDGDVCILFILKENKSGVSIAHISPYEIKESEILAPSGTKYQVNNITESVVNGKKWMYVFLHEI